MKNRRVVRVGITAITGALLLVSLGVGITDAIPAEPPLSVIESKLDQILAGISGNDLRGVTQNWDKKLNASNGDSDGCNSDRFTCIFDGHAVRDNETGLVSQQTQAGGRTTWAVARVVCLSSNVGGRKGWRLPSVHEMASLIDATQPVPTLPTGHPFTIDLSSSHWSATLSADNPAAAWHVQFTNGLVSNFDRTSSAFSVWCVRGPVNADTY
jgi:hypothetical protein